AQPRAGRAVPRRPRVRASAPTSRLSRERKMAPFWKNASVATILGERVEELRRARNHGGSWMARRAVEALVEIAEEDAASGEELLARLLEAGRELAASRPGVGAVAGAVGRLLAAANRQAQLEPE